MQTLYLIRHPATRVDRRRPPEEWQLSEEGDRQLEALLERPFWRQVRHIYSSSEPKAVVVAQRAAEADGVPFSLHAELRELRRPSFVADYEGMVGRVFEMPQHEIDGWESLESALTRVSSFLRRVAERGLIPAAVVSHGLVLSAARAKLLGREAPDLTEWRRLPFGGVAEMDVSKWRLLEDFVPGSQ
jgi:broad specificity phosphatase PhoE